MKYVDLFIDQIYPSFIDKYLNTKTMSRLKSITQFCGCDYTKLYSPRYLFTRYEHSLVVAHMTWHFTHDKKQTLAALFHDIGTPCFAHTIDLVFNDYLNQESSEKKITTLIQQDHEFMTYLKEDNMKLADFQDLSIYPILENKSPQLCTDRLDGVFHTCYIWLHTHSLEQIKEVYDDMTIVTNELNLPEIGFQHQRIAEKFVGMVFVYAIELQSSRNKYVMGYISQLVTAAFHKGKLTKEDLYNKKETEIISLFQENFPSWNIFKQTTLLSKSEQKPKEYAVKFETKKRNTIPLVKRKRIIDISENAKKKYQKINDFKEENYGYIPNIYKEK